MKKACAYFLIFFVSISIHSQKLAPDIVPVNKIDSLDLYRIMELMEVAHSRYSVDARFKEYNCNLIMLEYRMGKCVDTISMTEQVPSFVQKALLIGANLVKGKFDIGIYSKVIADTSLKIYATIGGAGIHTRLNLDKEKHYSWKDVYRLPDAKHPLKPGELFPLLTYTSPVGQKFAIHPNAVEFCNISGEFVAYPDWYDKLGIEHYFIFFINLEKSQ